MYEKFLSSSNVVPTLSELISPKVLFKLMPNSFSSACFISMKNVLFWFFHEHVFYSLKTQVQTFIQGYTIFILENKLLVKLI